MCELTHPILPGHTRRRLSWCWAQMYSQLHKRHIHQHRMMLIVNSAKKTGIVTLVSEQEESLTHITVLASSAAKATFVGVGIATDGTAWTHVVDQLGMLSY